MAARSATAPDSMEDTCTGVCHRADCGNIPRDGLAIAPWDKGTTVWPITTNFIISISIIIIIKLHFNLY